LDAKQENGVITVSMLAKIRRMHFRDGVPLRDIARKTGLSRNTIRRWLREPSTGEPKYAKRVNNSVVDPWSEQLRLWLVADAKRTRRERRSATQMYEDLRTAGYDGSYDRVSAFVRNCTTQKRALATPEKVFIELAWPLSGAVRNERKDYSHVRSSEWKRQRVRCT
jgi:transposase